MEVILLQRLFFWLIKLALFFFLVLISERMKKLKNYKKVLCLITADTLVPSLTTRNAYFTDQHLKAVFS